MNIQEAKAAWRSHRPVFEGKGVTVLPSVVMYVPDEFRNNYALALDAQPGLSTDPSSSIPTMLTTMIDPQVYKVLFAPNKAVKIATERRKGTWLDQTAMFPIVEAEGEVSSYGDFVENGHTSVNTNFPQRQSYLYQILKEYGELEMERAGLARINWVTEIDVAAALTMNKFQNLSYFYGIAGLQNYGLFNDPGLTASLTPSLKAFGNNKWITGTAITATANEIYADIQSLYLQLVNQTNGLIDSESKMVLAMSPGSEVALTATNSFNVNVHTLLKKNFPNIRIETAVQYGALSASNPQGVAAGNFVQLIAEQIEGQETLYCSYNEKSRAHAIIKATSSFKQKVTGGTWGCVVRGPAGISSMIGI